MEGGPSNTPDPPTPHTPPPPRFCNSKDCNLGELCSTGGRRVNAGGVGNLASPPSAPLPLLPTRSLQASFAKATRGSALAWKPRGGGWGGAGLPRTVNKPRRGGRAGGGKLGRRGPDCLPCLALPCLPGNAMQCHAMQCKAKRSCRAGPDRGRAGPGSGGEARTPSRGPPTDSPATPPPCSAPGRPLQARGGRDRGCPGWTPPRPTWA